MYDDSFRKRYGIAPIAISSTTTHGPTPPHIHNEIELLWIEKGSAKLKIANNTYDAKAGDLFFVNPLEIHAVTPNEDAPYFHRCICFDCSLIADRELASSLQKGYRSILSRFAGEDAASLELRALSEKLFAVVEENPQTLLFDSTAVVSMIFSCLIRNRLLTEKYLNDKTIVFCNQVLTYLAEHYSEAITSKELAQAHFYTQSYFCRAFKKHFGVRFSEYLNTYRLLIAKEKLDAGSMKVAEIATACGFASAAYFTRCFKESFGMTPLSYRKSQPGYKI